MALAQLNRRAIPARAEARASLGAQCRRMLRPLLLLAGCAQHPDGVEAVRDFDAERYLGTWYEIARLDNRFERGLDNVTAQYGLRNDGGIDVLNRGHDRERNHWREARGRAYFVDGRDVGALRVSFFRPFYGGYNVIALDRENYQWAMVCGPDRSYLWILSRKPGLDPAVLQSLRATAADLGFAPGDLKIVRHDPQWRQDNDEPAADTPTVPIAPRATD